MGNVIVCAADFPEQSTFSYADTEEHQNAHRRKVSIRLEDVNIEDFERELRAAKNTVQALADDPSKKVSLSYTFTHYPLSDAHTESFTSLRPEEIADFVPDDEFSALFAGGVLLPPDEHDSLSVSSVPSTPEPQRFGKSHSKDSVDASSLTVSSQSSDSTCLECDAFDNNKRSCDSPPGKKLVRKFKRKRREFQSYTEELSVLMTTLFQLPESPPMAPEQSRSRFANSLQTERYENEMSDLMDRPGYVVENAEGEYHIIPCPPVEDDFIKNMVYIVDYCHCQSCTKARHESVCFSLADSLFEHVVNVNSLSTLEFSKESTSLSQQLTTVMQSMEYSHQLWRFDIIAHAFLIRVKRVEGNLFLQLLHSWANTFTFQWWVDFSLTQEGIEPVTSVMWKIEFFTALRDKLGRGQWFLAKDFWELFFVPEEKTGFTIPWMVEKVFWSRLRNVEVGCIEPKYELQFFSDHDLQFETRLREYQLSSGDVLPDDEDSVPERY